MAEQLDLKIRYSEEFLRVIGLVDPGLTKVYREIKRDRFRINDILVWKIENKNKYLKNS